MTETPAPEAPAESTAADVPEAVAERNPYIEREDWVPSGTDITGSVDTTGTGGDLGGRIENISPVFAQARADALGAAVAAVESPAVAAPVVVLPESGKSYDDAVSELRAAADAAAANPQLSTGLSPAQIEAAQEGEPVNPNAEPTAPAEGSETSEPVLDENGNPVQTEENPPA
jgi:hypothetical protein